MSAFWIINLALWSIVMALATKGAFTTVFRPSRARLYDPRRLAIWLTAGLFVGHIARWMWWPGSLDLWKALYVIGALTAVYQIRLLFAYGRGPHV